MAQTERLTMDSARRKLTQPGATGDVTTGRDGNGRPTQSMPEDIKLRQYADRVRTDLLNERRPYDADNAAVSEYVDPTRGRFFEGPGTSRPVNRVRRRSRAKIINNTATKSVRTAAAGFSSHMTSKSRPWFKVETPVAELNDNYEVRVWLDAVTARLSDTLARGNFYKSMPNAYTEDIEFGATAMLMPAHDEEVIRFRVLTWGTFAIGLGEDGKVNRLYREFDRTAEQLKTAYGEDNLPVSVKDALRNNRGGTYFTVSALMERNPDERPGMGPLGLQIDRFRPWRELIWMPATGNEGHACLKIKGYYEQPFVAGRWDPTDDEVYSSSPCLDSLGDIKGLQYMEGQKYKLIDLLAEPPLGLPDTMKNTPASLSPRSKTYLPISQQGPQAGPLYEVDPQGLNACVQDIRELEGRIRDALFTSLFLMLASLEDRDRTATEIAERRDERAVILGPTVEVITDEMLDPIIVRVFRELERRGEIPPAPPALANLPLKIEYTSILAQAMKAAGLASIERAIGFSASIVQATGDPSHFDKIDFDQAQDEFSARVSAPATIVRSDEQVAQIREGRAQQQRAQQMAAMAKPAADAAKAYQTLAETVPEDGSAAENLGALVGGAQQ